MYGKTPMTRALVGKQSRLNAGLRAALDALPETPKKNINNPSYKMMETPKKNIKNPSYKMMDDKSPMGKKGCGCMSGACMCGKRK